MDGFRMWSGEVERRDLVGCFWWLVVGVVGLIVSSAFVGFMLAHLLG